MCVILEPRDLYNQPYLLTLEQRQSADGLIRDFFSDYRLSDVKEFLETSLHTCLTTDETIFSEAEKRANLIQFHKRLEILVQAAFVTFQHKRRENID